MLQWELRCGALGSEFESRLCIDPSLHTSEVSRVAAAAARAFWSEAESGRAVDLRGT